MMKDMAKDLDKTMENLRKSSKGLEENMEAAKHNFLLRGYFKKKEKEKEKGSEKSEKAKKEAEKNKKNKLLIYEFRNRHIQRIYISILVGFDLSFTNSNTFIIIFIIGLLTIKLINKYANKISRFKSK